MMSHMSSETPVQYQKKSWPFIVTGIACVVGVPLSLYLKYGDAPITEHIALIAVYGFGVSLSGVALIIVGIWRHRGFMRAIEKVSDNSLTRRMVALDQPSSVWKVWCAVTIIDLLVMASTWRNQYGFGLSAAGRYYAVALLLLFPVIFFISWKIWRRSMPWYIALIDPRLQPKDEREQSIIQQAALTTVGAMVFIGILAMVMILLYPPTSANALVWLMVAGLGVVRTVFGYIVSQQGFGR